MLLELRAARAWQVRPSEFAKWSRRDRVQALALIVHEDSIGPCGHPHTKTLDPSQDLDGWFEVRADTYCPACMASDEFKRNAGEDLPAGVVLRVVNTKDHPDED